MPADLPPDTYQLVVYTNYQLNSESTLVFRKSIRILRGLQLNKEESAVAELNTTTFIEDSAMPTTKVRFFPEGGDCIAGIPCNIAFMAENENGQPLVVEGMVQDENGKAVTFIKSDELGVGTFRYTPQLDQRFSLQLQSNQQVFDLSLIHI